MGYKAQMFVVYGLSGFVCGLAIMSIANQLINFA